MVGTEEEGARVPSPRPGGTPRGRGLGRPHQPGPQVRPRASLLCGGSGARADTGSGPGTVLARYFSENVGVP